MSVKLSKPGIPVDIAGKKDLIFELGTETLMVHAIVKVSDTSGYYEHNLGYVPIVLFMKNFSSGSTTYYDYANDKLRINSTSVSFPTTEDGYIIIFKNKLYDA